MIDRLAPWLAVMTAQVLCSALPLAALQNGAPGYGDLAAARVVATPTVPRPDYLQPVTDPAFATHFTRITDPGRQIHTGISCGPAYCTHRYSSSQAWNADQSLLVIANGCGGFCFLDGQSYEPLFQHQVPNECEWHPIDPALMICTSSNTIYAWAPRTDVKTPLFAPDDYGNFEFGPYKGNPSSDGNRLVVRAATSAGAPVAFAYDISARKKYRDIELSALPGRNGHCGISPSGRYILCLQTTLDETEVAFVFTVNGVLVQHWSEHHRPGHGDMTIDADGSDVYVGISKSAPDKYHIIKRRLEDGQVTDLAPYGEAQHASVRNTRRPGWAVVTYAGDYSEIVAHPQWAPFYQEVIALRIDGSGEIRRIVQTRSANYDYRSEVHASPSPDASQVIWSSNWGEAGGPVADYVARLSWPQTTSRKWLSHQ